jgi:transposase InsO family protein
MPWEEVKPMDQRFRFVFEAIQAGRNMAALCQRYGISRKTGYKWLNRYDAEGVDGVYEKSRRPHSVAHRTPESIEELLLKEKQKHPSWGPKKLVAILRDKHGVVPPAASTAGAILQRNGLVKPRKRKRFANKSWPGKLTQPERPNHVWAADYKGWFRTQDREKCHPLTVSDLYSRYLLCVDAHPGYTHAASMKSFGRVFSEYGLPEVIRVDNGVPFAGPGLANLSRLSVAWMRLGIRVEFIKPGRPDQNGCHERMHKTLKAETTRPPAKNRTGQQKRFDGWRDEFNEHRPHEALGQKAPGSMYKRSNRACPVTLPNFEYPSHLDRRNVRCNGEIKWGGQSVFIGTGFIGARLGIDSSHPDGAAVYAGDLILGIIEPGSGRGTSPSLNLVRIV